MLMLLLSVARSLADAQGFQRVMRIGKGVKPLLACMLGMFYRIFSPR
jgi:hypothetical protein